MDIEDSTPLECKEDFDAADQLQNLDNGEASVLAQQTYESVSLPSYLLEEPQSPVSEEEVLPLGQEYEHKFSQRLMCIEYPGVVENEANALQTLGGIQNIGIAYGKRNRRLELRFRPDDYYCKPACASQHPVTALLIKVKVKKGRKESDTLVKPIAQTCSFEVKVLGTVDTIYRFRSLCDFQYIPTDGHNNIYDTLMPQGFPPFSWLLEESDYFLPPAAFSRMDNMQLHLYSKEKADSAPQHIIGRTRSKRAGHAVFVNFLQGTIPNEPRPHTLRLIQSKNIDGERVKQLSELFEQRPIWSKSGLMAESTLTKDQMKFVLPAVAYYFINGPWRVLWVKFGFDPRQHVDARNLQTLDFRLRTAGGLKTQVKAKRSYSNYVLPYKSTPVRPKVRTINRPDIKSATEPDDEPNYKEDTGYIFRPGFLPPSRQMFYQYCDLHVPEIQSMLEKLPSLPPNAKCHPRRGWMPPGIDDQCRNILNNLVLEKLLADIKNKENPGSDESTPSTTAIAEPLPSTSSALYNNEEESCDSEENTYHDEVDIVMADEHDNDEYQNMDSDED